MTEYRFCTRKRHFAPVSEFRRMKGGKDGLGRWCKSCRTEYQREWRARNPGYAECRHNHNMSRVIAWPRVTA